MIQSRLRLGLLVSTWPAPRSTPGCYDRSVPLTTSSSGSSRAAQHPTQRMVQWAELTKDRRPRYELGRLLLLPAMHDLLVTTFTHCLTKEHLLEHEALAITDVI